MTRPQRIALILTALVASVALVLGPILGVSVIHRKVENSQPCKKACQRAIAAQVVAELQGGGHRQSGNTPGQQPGPGDGAGGDTGPPGPPAPDGPGLLDPVCDLQLPVELC